MSNQQLSIHSFLQLALIIATCRLVGMAVQRWLGILNRIKEANAPHKMLSSSDLRDYIVSTLVENFPGTRFDRVPNTPVEIYEARLSSRAMAEFSRFLDTSAKRYPTRFRRDGGSGVRVIFGSNPDPGRYRAIDTVPMTHPLARFASEVRQRRFWQSGNHHQAA